MTFLLEIIYTRFFIQGTTTIQTRCKTIFVNKKGGCSSWDGDFASPSRFCQASKSISVKTAFRAFPSAHAAHISRWAKMERPYRQEFPAQGFPTSSGSISLSDKIPPNAPTAGIAWESNGMLAQSVSSPWSSKHPSLRQTTSHRVLLLIAASGAAACSPCRFLHSC